MYSVQCTLLMASGCDVNVRSVPFIAPTAWSDIASELKDSNSNSNRTQSKAGLKIH